MTGYELGNRLRRLPMHRKTPVVFVTRPDDFNNRAKSMMVVATISSPSRFSSSNSPSRPSSTSCAANFSWPNDRESYGFRLPAPNFLVFRERSCSFLRQQPGVVHACFIKSHSHDYENKIH
jgi:hypothetical protein